MKGAIGHRPSAIAGCAAPSRNLTSVPPGKEGCAALEKWAEEKNTARPQREGESSALDDSLEASVCWRRQNDLARARGALLRGLSAEASAASAHGWSDAIARKAAAIALSARKAEAYGAQDSEHVEELGRWAGLSYVRRDDGREQFLVATKLIEERQEPPQKLFAEAMSRRGRPIEPASPATLAGRPRGRRENSPEAPLFHLALNGFAFSDARSAWDKSGLDIILRGGEGGSCATRTASPRDPERAYGPRLTAEGFWSLAVGR